MAAIALKDIQDARDVIGDVVRNTPLKRSTTLSDQLGGDFHLKLENFQRTGSFKVRGATWKVHNLTDDERTNGVVAASAGNHAQGVAYAATRAGVESHVFMPEDAPLAKVRATKGYGATVHLKGHDYQSAQEHAQEYQKETGATFVHAFEDRFIMAGQGTVGLEIMESLPDLETLLVPIGGGGLIAGVATAVKAIKPDVHIVGVQADGASTVAASLDKGTVVPLDTVATIADGIACRRLGDMTFEAIQEHVDEIVTVSEAEIAAAILFLLERTKTTVEGAGAVTLAAAMNGHVDLEGKVSCAVVSGGNIDMTLMSRIIQQGLVKEGRVAVIEGTILDKPGAIARLLNVLAEAKANVLDVRHDRQRGGMALNRTHVEVHVETAGMDHVQRLGAAIAVDYSDLTVRTA